MQLPTTEAQLAALIDQTNLRPNATESEMRLFLEDVCASGYTSAAILTSWVAILLYLWLAGVRPAHHPGQTLIENGHAMKQHRLTVQPAQNGLTMRLGQASERADLAGHVPAAPVPSRTRGPSTA